MLLYGIQNKIVSFFCSVRRRCCCIGSPLASMWIELWIVKPKEKGQTAKIQATVVVENKVKTEAKMKQIIGEGQYEKQGEEHHHCW